MKGLIWLGCAIAALDQGMKSEIEQEEGGEFPRDLLLARKGSAAQKIGFTMVLGGAVSNLYDRFKRGYVVDYFSFSVKGIQKVVFNLGDMAVFLGSALFLIGEMTEEYKGR